MGPFQQPPARLLRGLIAPVVASPSWLPCHHLELLASVAAAWHWLPPRLPLPRWRWPCGGDGFKLLLVLLMVSAMLAEVRFVASSSMAPTLRAGDRVVAEKVTYLFRKPSVGDIVFFRVPAVLQNYGLSKDVVFIKRILATPGDFIEVRQGQLLINGVAQKEHYIAGHASYTMEAMCEKRKIGSVEAEEQKWPGCSMLLTSRVLHCNEHSFHYGPQMRLPAGHVFVMGDNRNNSCDSRAWGPLPISNIVGKYMMSFSRSSFQ